MMTIDSIRHMVSQETYRRGESYHSDGRVRALDVRDGTASANVSGKSLYAVKVNMTGRSLRSSCTCSVGRRGEICKHVVATLLALVKRSSEPQTPGMEEIRHLMAGSDPSSRGRRRVPAWARSLAKVLEQKEEPSTGAPVPFQWRIAFALSIRDRTRHLFPLRIRLKKDGTDGQATPLVRVARAERELLEPTQRTLLAMTLPRTTLTYSVDGSRIERWKLSPSASGADASTDDFEWNDLLLLLQHQELYLESDGENTAHRLSIDPQPGKAVFSLSEAGKEYTLYPEIDWNGTTVPISEDMIMVTAHPLWILTGNILRKVEGIDGVAFLRLQRMHSPVVIPPQDRDVFLRNAIPQLLARYSLHSNSGDIQILSGTPTCRLYLKESGGSLLIEPRFVYGCVEVAPDPPPGQVPETRATEGGIATVRRDPITESDFLNCLIQSGVVSAGPEGTASLFIPDMEPIEWLTGRLPQLRKKGVEVFGEDFLKRYRIRTGNSSIQMGVSSGIDWFDLTVNVSFEGTPASLEAFIRAVQEERRFVQLTDGSYGKIPERWLDRFKSVAMFGSTRGNALRLSRSHLTLLDELGEGEDFNGDETFEVLRSKLRSFSGVVSCSLPKGFTGTLRPYQQAGFDWLVFLHEFGFGGLLADDMGLGKTIQALAVLQWLRESEGKRPSLVVVPTSLVHNWQREASVFTPGLRVLLYHGIDRKRHRPGMESYDLIITSYGILRRDIEFLSTLPLAYIVLDESQAVKNFASVNARAARRLKAEHRLALTGTPVENNLTELWSQFQFLNHGLLGGLHSFTENIVRPIERTQDEEAVSQLRKVTRPFLLRRTKELVAADLPPKFESIVLCSMEDAQRNAYQHWREYYRQSILKNIDSLGIKRNAVRVLEGLTKLRLVCCHPQLADERYRGSSGKFEAFIEMMNDILAENHKVLVFSQFVRMLSILRQHLDRREIPYEYLDGRTVRRKEHIERFQDDERIKAFLISLRAGGTGLNLTAADYVIHYDPWWNPAVEAQATDRTHRIGQTRPVFSYKLITRDSVEEKILALQERKKILVGKVISTESGFLKSLTREDIEELFS